MAISLLIVQALGIWLLFVIVAIVNGAIRETLLVRLVGEYPAHVIGVVVLSLAVFIISAVFVRRARIFDARILLSIGATWVVLTVAFEFLFGHYAMGETWSELLRAHNVFTGNLWVLVLLVIFISPLLCRRFFGD